MYQMSNNASLKLTITQAILDQLPDKTTPIEELISLWWLTKSKEGLRLSSLGDEAFRQAQIEFFDLPLDIKMNKWHFFLVDCSKKLRVPYYFGVNKAQGKKLPFVRIYDSKTAMLVQLYGDLPSYLESVKIRK